MIKKCLTLVIFFLSILPANADASATNTLLLGATAAANITITGTFAATMDATNGVLGNPMSITYSYTGNTKVTNGRFIAEVTNSTGAVENAFQPLGGTATTQNCNLVFGNATYRPLSSAISDCKQTTPTPSLNADAVAYPGTITLTRGNGTIAYNAAGYYVLSMNSTKFTMSMSLAINPKSGTYDALTSLDDNGAYQVVVYIDNLP